MRRLGIVIVPMLIAVLSVGLVSQASAGDGGGDNKPAKKKKPKCPAGTIKKVVVKKNGKRKRTCVPQPVQTPATPTTPALGSTLTISPASVNWGNRNQSGFDSCNFGAVDPDCPEQVFTITNSGPGPSGTPVVSMTANTVDGNGEFGHLITVNGCTAPLAPGGACLVTTRSAADDNFVYISTLNVSASPGTAVAATLQIQ